MNPLRLATTGLTVGWSIATSGILAALILIVFFGVSPNRIVHQVSRVPQALRQLITEGNAPWSKWSQVHW